MRIAGYIITFVAMLQIGCNSSPTAPLDKVTTVYGRLAGLVRIGPNCPVERADNPCPTPPSAYALRKILVFDEQRTQLLHTVDIDNQGLYSIDLSPAKYLIDLKGAGVDRADVLPKVVEIHANTVTNLDVTIDTGLR